MLFWDQSDSGHPTYEIHNMFHARKPVQALKLPVLRRGSKTVRLDSVLRANWRRANFGRRGSKPRSCSLPEGEEATVGAVHAVDLHSELYREGILGGKRKRAGRRDSPDRNFIFELEVEWLDSDPSLCHTHLIWHLASFPPRRSHRACSSESAASSAGLKRLGRENFSSPPKVTRISTRGNLRVEPSS